MPTPSTRHATKVTRDQAIAELWRRGELGWLLKPSQRPIYAAIKLALWGLGGYLNPTGAFASYVLELVRRFGKSFICGVIACELCIQKKHARVHWAAETGKQVTRILIPNMRIILESCPPDMKPTWLKSEDKWVWPTTGSEIYMVGCEDEAKADRLRGDGSDLFIPDEAGHIDPLEYVLKSIATYMVLRTNGRILIPSTPAKTPGHAFVYYAVAHEASGAYQHRTIFESDLTPEQIERVWEGSGGGTDKTGWEETGTTDWMREGLAMRVVDATRAVLPEFVAAKKTCIAAWPRPDYFDAYTACDIGWDPDLTFVVFAYYDFKAAKLIIEDELVLARMTTDVFAGGIDPRTGAHVLDDMGAEAIGVKDIEDRLWSSHWDKLEQQRLAFTPEVRREVHKRTGDVDDRIISDLIKNHSLSFMKTAKHDKDSAINELRMWLKADRVRINPRCKQLIAHCEAGIWNKRRTEYERVKGFGHFDGIDALVYLRRNVDEQRNPYPDVPYEIASQPERHHIRVPVGLDPLQGLANLFATPGQGA